MKWYIAGPMSGVPQFNFPMFKRVAAELRKAGMSIVSPAELDEQDGIDKQAMASSDGDASKLSSTWADLLARDVKLIADHVQGIVFLPGWERSRGARLEAFVGLLQKDFTFLLYHEGWLGPLSRAAVMGEIARITSEAS